MNEKKTRPGPRLVGSVSRALQIIELLVGNRTHELGITQIARELGVSKSTAHQLVSTLAAHGFVDHPEGSTRYRLGIRTMEAGTVAATHIGLGPALTPILETLVRTVNETCSIGVIAGRDVLLVQRVEPASILRVDLKAGARLPLHNSGIGRAILASMPMQARKQLLSEINISNPERLEAEIAIKKAAADGYSIVRNIPVDGISAIAVAIYDKDQRPVAGLVIAGPTFRFEPTAFSRIAIETAATISARLGANRLT